MDWGGTLPELKAYLIYVAALCSVFVLQIVMATINLVALTGGVPVEIAVWTGIPTPGGAPGYIHAINMMGWSLPGIVSMRWVLGFINGNRPPWARVFAGYLLAGLLVWVLVAAAERFPAYSAMWQLVGIVACLTLGYAFARLFVLRSPQEAPPDAELEGI